MLGFRTWKEAFAWANSGQRMVDAGGPAQVVYPINWKWGRLLKSRYILEASLAGLLLSSPRRAASPNPLSERGCGSGERRSRVRMGPGPRQDTVSGPTR